MAEQNILTKGIGSCDCVHLENHHDPVTGACLYTNWVFGPCPCGATSLEVRAVLNQCFKEQKIARQGEKITPKLYEVAEIALELLNEYGDQSAIGRGVDLRVLLREALIEVNKTSTFSTAKARNTKPKS